jgi:hypothetical protein
MSAASLAIWITCGSLLVAAGSLVVSVAAYRRSDTLLRRLDRLGELSRAVADLRPRLDQLERTISKAAQSRAPASAALGSGFCGGMKDSIPKRADYAGIEKTKLVTAREVSTRLEQLVQYMRDRAARPR